MMPKNISRIAGITLALVLAGAGAARADQFVPPGHVYEPWVTMKAQLEAAERRAADAEARAVTAEQQYEQMKRHSLGERERRVNAEAALADKNAQIAALEQRVARAESLLANAETRFSGMDRAWRSADAQRVAAVQREAQALERVRALELRLSQSEQRLAASERRVAELEKLLRLARDDDHRPWHNPIYTYGRDNVRIDRAQGS